MFHARMKHIELDYHFVREQVAGGSIQVHFLSSENQLANMFTKPLSFHHFQFLCTKLGGLYNMQGFARG